MYDDDDDDLGYDDEEETVVLDTQAASEKTFGEAERTYYDDLAKQDDVRRRKIMEEFKKRSTALNEVRLKLKTKQRELRLIDERIAEEHTSVDLEKAKFYRKEARAFEDEAARLAISVQEEKDAPAPDISGTNPAGLSREAVAEHELKLQLAHVSVRDLKPQKESLEYDIAELKKKIDDEQRELSLIEHRLRHM